MKWTKFIGFVAWVYVTWILFFIIQKPLFILYHQGFSGNIHAAEYVETMIHGLRLDTAVSGYLTAVPALVALIGMWHNTRWLRKALHIYFLLAVALVAIIFGVDIELYRYWQFRLDATALFYAQSPQDAMASVPIGLFVRQVAIMIVYAALMYLYLRRIVLPFYPQENAGSLEGRCTGSGAWIVAAGLLFISIRGGVTTSTANVGRVYFSTNQFLNHAAINPCFSLLASLSKSEDFASQFNAYPDEEATDRFDKWFPAPAQADTLQLLKETRPHVLVIILESFSANVIGALGGEPDVTPCFNQLSQEGILFTQCYASSFRTDRGLVATLSGYPGQPTTSIMKIPAKSRTLPSLAGSLRKAGYTTDVLYGGDIDFTNMRSYFLGTGYEQLTSDVDFPVSDRLSKWGAQDDVTFSYLFKMLKERNGEPRPWHTMYLTLSTHEPFEVPYHKWTQPYLNTMAYADSCLGHFVDCLKQEPIWEHTLIVLIADHGYRYPDTFKEYEPARYHIPMLWIGGAIKRPRRVDAIVSQTDMVATLLGQMQLPHETYRFSRDIFNPNYREPFAFYTFNNGFAVIDSTGVSVYDNVGQQTLYQQPENGNDTRLEKGKTILQILYDDLGNR